MSHVAIDNITFLLETHPSEILSLCPFTPVSLFTMLSRGQPYILDTLDTARLDCEFHASYYNLFDNPVIWSKIQYHESSEMNIMGNLKEPYKSTDRFEVTFRPSPPRYMVELVIRGGCRD